MTVLTRSLWRWFPLAVLATALCALVYFVAQQQGRQAANDPQIQMARDAAMALSTGQPAESVVPPVKVDFSRSLAPFVMVLDNAGAVIATSGHLGGQTRVPPPGVLDHVRETGEAQVTWQPEPGVRLATVVVRRLDAGGGFVVAGRSLAETELRIQKIQPLVGLAWIVVVVTLLALVAAGESVIGADRAG